MTIFGTVNITMSWFQIMFVVGNITEAVKNYPKNEIKRQVRIVDYEEVTCLEFSKSNT
jgi:hypothetical protein